jgi:hypothetical protein
MLVIHSSKRYLQLWRRIKNKSFNIRETLYTSYKNAYAMTQEIKKFFNKRKNMIPNIKSSEWDGVLKKGLQAQSPIMFSVLWKPSTLPLKSSVREHAAGFYHWEKQPRKLNRRELLASDLYIIKKNRVFLGSSFNT